MKYITYTPGTYSHFVGYGPLLITELEASFQEGELITELATSLPEGAATTTTARPIGNNQDLLLILFPEKAAIFTIELSADGISWTSSHQFSQPGCVSLSLRCRSEGNEKWYRIKAKSLRAQNRIAAYSQLHDAALLPDPKPLQWS